jgi:hypothetical protein
MHAHKLEYRQDLQAVANQGEDYSQLDAWHSGAYLTVDWGRYDHVNQVNDHSDNCGETVGRVNLQNGRIRLRPREDHERKNPPDSDSRGH